MATAAVVAAAHGQAGPQPGPVTREATAGAQSLDVNKLFAGSCGWCHAKGGRAAGKGPQLMGTELSDAQIISRIRNGKTGQMPAFPFTDAELHAIVAYIRGLQ